MGYLICRVGTTETSVHKGDNAENESGTPNQLMRGQAWALHVHSVSDPVF